MSAIRAGEIVIEIDHPRNGDVMFDPIALALRSRFITHRSGPRAQAPLNQFNTAPIPGQRIHLDLKRGIGRITDPLADPENAELLKTINDVNVSLQPPRPLACAQPELEFRLQTKNGSGDRETWMYFMRRLLEPNLMNTAEGAKPNTAALPQKMAPMARMVQDNFPSQYPTTLELRQTGLVKTCNPMRLPGESAFIPILSDEEIESRKDELAAVGT
jgi:hypothetical protein